LAIGSPGRARELLEEAIVGNPSLPEAHYTLGQAYEMQKDWPGAIRAYNSFIRVAPPRLAPQIDLVRRRVEALTARVK
jgi:tetratricopeptide (TPR) repeat protein